MRFGPDFSNYQAQFSIEDAQKLASEQCSFAFIGRQKNNTWASHHRDLLIAAGIQNIGEYLISLRGEWPVLFAGTVYVAVDVEPGSEFVTEQAIDEAVQWIRGQGRTPLIYSASWAWDAVGLAAVTKYASIGLWNAYYDGLTNGYELPTPFGGWPRCVVNQYTAAWDDGGLAYPLDMNNCEDGFWPPATPPAVDARVVEAHRLLGEVIGG